MYPNIGNVRCAVLYYIGDMTLHVTYMYKMPITFIFPENKWKYIPFIWPLLYVKEKLITKVQHLRHSITVLDNYIMFQYIIHGCYVYIITICITSTPRTPLLHVLCIQTDKFQDFCLFFCSELDDWTTEHDWTNMYSTLKP